MYRNGPNSFPTCGLACASKLQDASGVSNTNRPPSSDPPSRSSTPDIFGKNWESPRRTSETTQTYTDTSTELCVVSSPPKILSILVTIRRSAIVHSSIGLIQTSILLVEGYVLPNCDLPTIYAIPINLPFPSHTLQTILSGLQHLEITPISPVLTLVLTRWGCVM